MGAGPKVVVLVALATGAAAPARAETPLTSSFPEAGLTALVVHLPNGGVEVQARPDLQTVEVSVAREEWSEACTVEAKAVGDRVEVTVQKPEGTGPRVCSARVVIQAPPRLAVEIEAGTGEVSLGGVAGGGRVSVGVGDVRLADVGGPLEVKGGSGDLVGSYTGPALSGRWSSGDVRLTGLTGTVDLDVGVGRLDATWTRLPDSGVIRLNVAGGALTARFPPGAALDQDLDAKLAKVRADLASVPGAPVRLEARTTAGSLRILADGG